eukprot:scaffold37115_cov266-Skeletonema_dohrnii-CCMP3373.AAC.1
MVVMRSKGHRERPRAFISVVMECFNFDPSKQVGEVRRKLQSLLAKQEEMVLRGDSEDERNDYLMIEMKWALSVAVIFAKRICALKQHEVGQSRREPGPMFDRIP